MRSALDSVSACAAVLATTKSTPCRPAVIMLLTALPPAPPTPNTVIRGFISRMSGIFRLMVMFASLLHGQQADARTPSKETGPPPGPSWFPCCGSEAFAQPSSDPCHVTARSCHQLPRSPRFEVFKMRRLRVDQEACRHGECRPLGRLRQAGKAKRSSDTHGTLQDSRRQIGDAGQLAGAAGQHHARARLR